MIACRSLSLLYFPLKYLLSQHHTIGLQSWGWWDLVWYRVVEAWLTGGAGGNMREHTGVSAALLLMWASCLDLAWPAYTQVNPFPDSDRLFLSGWFSACGQHCSWRQQRGMGQVSAGWGHLWLSCLVTIKITSIPLDNLMWFPLVETTRHSFLRAA